MDLSCNLSLGLDIDQVARHERVEAVQNGNEIDTLLNPRDRLRWNYARARQYVVDSIAQGVTEVSTHCSAWLIFLTKRVLTFVHPVLDRLLPGR